MAPRDLDEVIINTKRNEKDRFTALGTCNVNETKKLIQLTKGTKKSLEKLKTKKKELVLPTNNDNGWLNENIMLSYLHYLHTNCVKKTTLCFGPRLFHGSSYYKHNKTRWSTKHRTYFHASKWYSIILIFMQKNFSRL